jgi:hypothetical protein
MRYRSGFVAIFVACAATLRGQDSIFKLELVPSGSVFSLSEPTLRGQVYTYRPWPGGASKSLRQARVRRITRLSEPVYDMVYKVDLIPSGAVTAKDKPTLKGGTYVFHTWRDGTYMSARRSDVRRITLLRGDKAFWTEEGQKREVEVGHLPMKGGTVIEIGNPATREGSAQAGPENASIVGRTRAVNRVAVPAEEPTTPAAQDGNSP